MPLNTGSARFALRSARSSSPSCRSAIAAPVVNRRLHAQEALHSSRRFLRLAGSSPRPFFLAPPSYRRPATRLRRTAAPLHRDWIWSRNHCESLGQSMRKPWQSTSMSCVRLRPRNDKCTTPSPRAQLTALTARALSSARHRATHTSSPLPITPFHAHQSNLTHTEDSPTRALSYPKLLWSSEQEWQSGVTPARPITSSPSLRNSASSSKLHSSLTWYRCSRP